MQMIIKFTNFLALFRFSDFKSNSAKKSGKFELFQMGMNNKYKKIKVKSFLQFDSKVYITQFNKLLLTTVKLNVDFVTH